MKKLIYLIVLALILVLVLTGCEPLSNISQVPATEQSEVSSLTKGDECPAAPAVAGLLLEAVGVDNRWGSGKDGGNYIADVAHEMGPETYFHGVEKCAIEDYRLEVAKFLILKGATGVAALFKAELESVVYGGTCNNPFGTYLDETLTFTFSNDVVLDPTRIPWLTPIVYFDVVSAIGTGPLNWTAEGNEVVITTTGTFITPRPDVGDMVTGLAGIFDALGNPVSVPASRVVVEGLTFNGNVEGLVGVDVYPNVTGFTTGDFETEIQGNLTGGVEGQWASFVGTISGDINGIVTGGVNYNGFDTLSAKITGSVDCVNVYLIGSFSGPMGEFEAKFVTQDSPIEFVSSIAITGGDSVQLGNTLQMIATTVPSGAEVAWTVWTGDGPSYGSATIDQESGLLTPAAAGIVIVIASALDGSLETENHVVNIVE